MENLKVWSGFITDSEGPLRGANNILNFIRRKYFVIELLIILLAHFLCSYHINFIISWVFGCLDTLFYQLIPFDNLPEDTARILVSNCKFSIYIHKLDLLLVAALFLYVFYHWNNHVYTLGISFLVHSHIVVSQTATRWQVKSLGWMLKFHGMPLDGRRFQWTEFSLMVA